jgi:putative phage-type endonuclease
MDFQSKVKQLIELYGFDDQRTTAWYSKRGEMLTASEIYKALPGASPALKHELIVSKLVPRQRTEGTGSRALLWGTRFEPIAKQIYCKMQGNIQIKDTTCIPHPKVKFLGASPDGIIVTPDAEDFRYGKLVEFKCPISREFSEESEIPHAYYHQMQLQMECTELKECEYIEMGFKELSYTNWVDSMAGYKSFYAVHNDGVQVKYKDFEDPRAVSTWKFEELKGDIENWDVLYWHLSHWRSKTVDHDANWLSTNLPSFLEIWQTIQSHRESETLPENPKDKKILIV